jgi:peroxiredoxin Q/BCP
LKDDTGKEVSLKDFKGKNVVLYFYPKDDTPGCTKEACDFRDNLKDYSKKNAVILGVSADDVASHDKFKKKYGLPFQLLSDPDKKTIQAYGVWKEKSMYGKKYMGISRESFLIDRGGKIVKHYEKVRPDTHAREVLDDVKTLGL